MFRVSHKGVDIAEVETIEDARDIVRNQSPGCYDVDEVQAEPFSTGDLSRAWGRLTLHPDGTIEEDPWLSP
jgi:hypothetical protein